MVDKLNEEDINTLIKTLKKNQHVNVITAINALFTCIDELANLKISNPELNDPENTYIQCINLLLDPMIRNSSEYLYFYTFPWVKYFIVYPTIPSIERKSIAKKDFITQTKEHYLRGEKATKLDIYITTWAKKLLENKNIILLDNKFPLRKKTPPQLPKRGKQKKFVELCENLLKNIIAENKKTPIKAIHIRRVIDTFLRQPALNSETDLRVKFKDQYDYIANYIAENVGKADKNGCFSMPVLQKMKTEKITLANIEVDDKQIAAIKTLITYLENIVTPAVVEKPKTGNKI